MADPTTYYVDHDNGNDSTGDGSSGTPWKTIEYAMETGIVTADTTNGDRIYVTGTGGETLTKTWLINSWLGGYVINIPLQIVGYSATVGDGVAAPVIKSASTFFIDASWGGNTGCVWANLNFQHNGSAAQLLDIDGVSGLTNCHFTRTVDTTGDYVSGTNTRNDMVITNCSFKDLGTGHGVNVYSCSLINCLFVERSTYAQNCTRAVNLSVNIRSVVNSCIFLMYNGIAIRCDSNTVVFNCSIHAISPGTGKYAIQSEGASKGGNRFNNNIISGYNNTSNHAIFFYGTNNAMEVVNNTFYDCTNTYDGSSGDFILDLGNETVATSPFVDPDNGDFTPVDTGSIKEGSYPSSFPDI